MVEILARVEFTEEMVARLYFHFGTFAKDGVVKVEIASNGVWVVNPTADTLQFLGAFGTSSS